MGKAPEDLTQREWDIEMARRAREGSSATGGSRNLTPAPSGASRSLDDLLSDADAEIAPPPVTAAPATPPTPPARPADSKSEPLTMPGQRSVDAAMLAVKWELVDDWSPYLNREVLLPLSLIVDSPFQLARNAGKRYDLDDLATLGEAMTVGYQEEAIQVRWVEGRFELIIGHRRTGGARLAGWTYIRAIIRVMDDLTVRQALLASNRARKDDFDYTLAKEYRFLTTDPRLAKRLTQKQIAAIYATNQTTVSKCLAMLTLPQPILDLLEEDPGLFNSNTAEFLRGLYAKYPDEGDVILKAVLRLKNGHPANSIVPWVNQMLAARRANDPEAARIAATDGRVVVSKAGTPLVRLSMHGSTLRLKLEDQTIDKSALAEMIYKWLRESTDQIARKPDDAI